MPRKLGDPESETTRALRTGVGDHLVAGTAEEFQERDAYDEEILGDEEFKKPRVPIPNISRTEFLRMLPQYQTGLGVSQRGKMTFAISGEHPQSFIRGVKHVSTTPLFELKPIYLEEMVIRQRHEGRYLLCRITTSAVRKVCMGFGVEDERGWLHFVTLHNFPYAATMKDRELKTIFPVDTVLAIREPYVKMSVDGTRCHTRIDSPSDLVFLEPEDPLVANSTWKTGPRPFPHTTLTDAEWKAVGNEHFRAEEYFAAVVAYTSGIRQNTSFITLRLNRALSYLRLGNFAAALSESQEVLSTPNLEKDSKVKALYRAGQASYGQADYLGARGWYEKLLVEDPNHKDAKASLERCGHRMKERETGEYDMAALMKSSDTEFERHDIADYQGPIEVAPMEGRGGGRGVVATREIKMGELLVVCKAFVAAHRTDYGQETPVITHDLLMKKWVVGWHHLAIQHLVAKVYSSPQPASALLDLYAGPDYPNVQTPVFNNSANDFHNRPLAFPMDIDMCLIENIFILNSLQMKGKDDRYDFSPTEATALFLLPAYFNHSCLPNASRVCGGDTMIIRAIVDIPKGEEITLAYGTVPRYDRRQEMLAKHFKCCDCELCKADRADILAQRQKRDMLVAKAEQQNMTLSQARQLVADLNQTYPPTFGTIRPALAYANQQLSILLNQTFHSGAAQMKPCIEASFNMLEASGVVVPDKIMDHDLPSSANLSYSDLPIVVNQKVLDPISCADMCILISIASGGLGLQRKSKQWLMASIWLENVAIGGGIKPYKIRHQDLQNIPEMRSLLHEIGEP